MENPRRQLILRYVEQNPGARFHEVKRQLGLPHGVLIHHLRILRTQNLLVAERDGRRLRLRLPGQRAPPHHDPNAAELLDLVLREPGLTIQQASDELGWSRRKTTYHVEALVHSRRIERQIAGRTRRLLLLRIAENTKLIPAQPLGPA